MYLLFVISGNFENYTFLVKDIPTNCFFPHTLFASSNGVGHIVESQELDKIGTLGMGLYRFPIVSRSMHTELHFVVDIWSY